MRVLVYLLSLSSVLCVVLHQTGDIDEIEAAGHLDPNPKGDRFCDRGIKAKYTENTKEKFFCCPAQCAGLCVADKDKCKQLKEKQGGSFNANCCIAEKQETAESCYDHSPPCKLELEWNNAQRVALNAAKKEAAAKAGSVRDYMVPASEHADPLTAARYHVGKLGADGKWGPYKEGGKNAVQATMAKFDNANTAEELAQMLTKCDAVWAKLSPDTRKECIDKIESDKVKEYSHVHEDHKYGHEDGKRINKGKFIDYWWAVEPNQQKKLAKCVQDAESGTCSMQSRAAAKDVCACLKKA